MNTVTVMLATYNESASIAHVIHEVALSAEILGKQGLTTEILLVDDDSPDGTAGIARTAARTTGLQLSVLGGKKQGLGAAYLRGFAHLRTRPDTDLIVTMDAHGQQDGRDIARLVTLLRQERYDVVIGSRWVDGATTPGLTPTRVANSRLGNLAFRTITGCRGVSDATIAFRAFRPAVLEAFDPTGLSVEGYSIQTSFVAMTVDSGFKIGEVPIEFRARIAGESKLSTHDYVEFLTNLFRIRRRIRSRS